MNPAVQRSVLLFTARPHGVGPHHQKLWNLLVFPSWRLRLLRVRLLFFILRSLCSSSVSRPSRVCVVNTSTRSLWILWTFTGSILTWTHSETLRGGWKEKIKKMSRTTWLRLQVWKQRQWCWVKVLYFHTWTQINSQFSLNPLYFILVFSRLDDCNSLLSGRSQKSLSCLQPVQNQQLLTGIKQKHHISLILSSLHWLPVRLRIDFKIWLITFKASGPKLHHRLLEPVCSCTQP